LCATSFQFAAVSVSLFCAAACQHDFDRSRYARADSGAVDLNLADLSFKDLGSDIQGDISPDTGDPAQMNCTKNTCYEHVASRLLLPTNSTEADKYALEYKGKKYNSYGNILALLVSQAQDLKLQDSMDQTVCQGTALLLLRTQANSLTGGSALTQTWTAADKTCCTTTTDTKKCCAEANTNCFAATSEHKPASTSPADQLFSGNIIGGKFMAGPSRMTLTVPLSATARLTLNLKHVVLKGDITATGIKNGVLSGAISKADLDKIVIPQIATMVNTTYTDAKTDQKTKDLLKTLFDTDKNGKITVAEVQNNPLIKTFLDGDVDVDGDSIKELSLGIGFQSTTCVIKTS